MTETFQLAPMARCDQCGQFMKRGLMNWADHLEICRGKPPKPIPPSEYPRFIPITAAGKKAIDKACKEYFENH